ncbi:DUF2628 domain-containing protein [Allosphingosinicella sp.]|jgi:hypothetical protein|uniref:DUF2628 domain-containing protein n=1 Tax=Allosphingosinicella sp. TaxID=2823234 RepID=UPI002F0FF7C0
MSDKPGTFDFAGQKARNLARWTATGWDELAAFIGPNAERFEHSWMETRRKIVDGKGGIAASFCWPALLFSFAWFFYRKMWILGGILLAAPAALALLDVNPGASLGGALAMALFGKSIYVQHAVGRIADIRERRGGDRELALAGGVSTLGGAGGGLILALGSAALVYSMVEGWP